MAREPAEVDAWDMSPEPSTPLRVVIAGGGIAAAEAALALRDFAGERVDVTLVAPEDTLEIAALAPARAFGRAVAQRLPMSTLMTAAGARHVRGFVASVDTGTRVLALRDGERVSYDALLVAVGARHCPAIEQALTFDQGALGDVLGGLRADVEQGFAESLAVVVPPGDGWPLPAYELAMLLRGTASAMSRGDVRVTLLSPEPAPLAMFGPAASDALARELSDLSVRWLGYRTLDVRHGHRTFITLDGGRELAVQRLLALPTAVPHRIEGLPADDAGFLPVDLTGRVAGAIGVWAAGDATTGLLKQGGLAAQAATVAAADIAALAGADPPRPTGHPVLRAVLVTPAGRRWMRRTLDGLDPGRYSDHPLWQPDGKIAAARLGSLLDAEAGDDGLGSSPAPRRFPRPAAGTPVEPLGGRG